MATCIVLYCKNEGGEGEEEEGEREREKERERGREGERETEINTIQEIKKERPINVGT